MFSQFAEEFTQRAHNGGVELYWIGVGIWKMPDIISEKQLEIWKLNQENLREGIDDAMKNVESEAFLQKMEGLIKNVPTGAYYDILGIRQHNERILARKQEIQFKDEENDDILLFDEKELLKTFDGKEIKIDDLRKLLNEKNRGFCGETNKKLHEKAKPQGQNKYTIGRILQAIVTSSAIHEHRK